MAAHELVKIKADIGHKLNLLLYSEQQFDYVEIRKLGWEIFYIDDKAIFDEESTHFEEAMRKLGCDSFFVATTLSILDDSSNIKAIKFPSNKYAIEKFQDANEFEMSLNDCLIFSIPINFAILRTGEVFYTLYAGPPTFTACFK